MIIGNETGVWEVGKGWVGAGTGVSEPLINDREWPLMTDWMVWVHPKEKEGGTLIAELLDVPHQVFQFIWVLLLIPVPFLAQKVGTLRFFVN